MFSVIHLGDPKWVAAVMGLPQQRRDIHLDQRMLCPYVAIYKWKAHLALTEGESGYILQPILSTPDGELRHSYNFGGPVDNFDHADTSKKITAKEHAENIRKWAKEQELNREYGTLVPNIASDQKEILDNAGLHPEFRKLAVVVNVNDMKIRGTTRRLANKAQGMGVTVHQYPDNFLSHFIQIYNETMARVHAQDHWKFSTEWFNAFNRFVKPCLMLADYRGQFVAGCLIAYSQQYPVAYYHFAGCLDLFLGKGINQQLVLAACEFVKSMGVKQLFLGGGVTDRPDDGLLVFKSGFSPLKQPVYSYRRTL